jgi:hypothetical protein
MSQRDGQKARNDLHIRLSRFPWPSNITSFFDIWSNIGNVLVAFILLLQYKARNVTLANHITEGGRRGGATSCHLRRLSMCLVTYYSCFF